MSQMLARTSGPISCVPGIKNQSYRERYGESIEDPEDFWGRIGKRLSWSHPYSKVKDVSFQEQDFRIRQSSPYGGDAGPLPLRMTEESVSSELKLKIFATW